MRVIFRRIITAKRRFSLNLRRKFASTMTDKNSTDIPIVVVLGETGVGKTKLAVELCQKFNGEVISADSMQIYEGLDIITNKVTEEETCGVPHHMISIVSPSSPMFNVQMFQKQASKIMEEIWTNRGKIPVIVGGTSYYIEALLWNRLVGSKEEEEEEEEGGSSMNNDTFLRNIPFDVESKTDEELHEELRRIDPVMASRKHPKNRRRVIRSLQVFYGTGRPHSEWLLEQHSTTGGSFLGGPQRFRRLCLLWLTCADREVLKDRLRRRVDEMVEKGLKEEITTFYDRYYGEYAQRFAADDVTTKGIFQSIGMKEFEKFLKVSTDERRSQEGEKAFEEGLEQLKMVTIRYARKQKQWIVNRICRLTARDSIPIYCFDATDATKWRENVSILSEHVVQRFLDGKTPEWSIKTATASLENYANEFTVENRFCDICERLITGLQWQAHVKSKRHRLMVLHKAPVPTVRNAGIRKDE